MAEFALGLTKTAVEGTLSRVKSAIEEEGKQRERVQEDLMFITGEFQMMQAFLNASSAKERASKNLVARAWVRQLRDLAFDVEDCVEFVVHLDEPSPWDWVQRLTSSLPCLSRPPLPLDMAVAEIKRLKTRVEDVSHRNTRYNLMAGGGDNDHENQHQQLMMRPAEGHTSPPGEESFGVLREIWKATGKLHDTTIDLKNLINCEGSELKVISLWGSPQADIDGELGWASIVKKAYDDPEICREFKNHAWVKVPHPFYPVEFLNNLLTQFTSRHHRHDDMSKLLQQVRQHKYLVILENELSSIADWDTIRVCLPDGNNGSRVIVATMHMGIARLCTGDPFQVWELKSFSHGRYRAFFPKGGGHRTGMAEFIWQLERHRGVISLFWRTEKERDQLIEKLHHQGKLRVLDGVQFEHDQCLLVEIKNGSFNLDYLATQILRHAGKEVSWESDENITIKRCREFLTEHDGFIFLAFIEPDSQEVWDVIKERLLCESTRACFVVITNDHSVANHCVEYRQHRVLNAEDLLNKGSNLVPDQSRDVDGGGNQQVHEGDWLVGRRNEFMFLYNFIRPHVPLLSVWGIAGVGKSAIVKDEYYRCKLQKYYKMYGWVDVPHPFNLTEMCRRLLLDLYSDDVDAKETAAIGVMEGQDPIRWCRTILRQNKCLLVIDGLGCIHDWDLIKATLLPQPKIGGTTVVISREESIATHCTNTEFDIHILNVKGLEADMALHLFKKITSGSELMSGINSEQEKILEQTVSKCGGLPDVITAIGKIGLTYSGVSWFLPFINPDFIRKLETMSSIHNLSSLLCWMKSYFDACSDELKPCIFYMLVFPAEQNIRRSRLLRRWIAEGYSFGGGGGTAEEQGEKLLSELMKLSILYQEKDTSTTSYKANGFFREYIKSQPMEDNLVFALEESCGPISHLTGQHLTIDNSWRRQENVYRSTDLSRLRSLTVFGDWRSFLICDKMKVLRVLDLEGTGTTPESDGTGVVKDDDLEMIGKQFPRLKFISLRGCIHITRLPDSLGAMRQLETLDVRHTSIVELPLVVITKLHKLQYIRASTTATTNILSPPPPPTPSPSSSTSIWPFSTPSPTPLSTAPAAAPPPSQSSPPPSPSSTLPPPSPQQQQQQPQQQEESHSEMSPFQRLRAAATSVLQGASTRIAGAWKINNGKSWWESKKQLDQRRRQHAASYGGGVEVVPAAAEGIGKLMHLHTLGVVDIAYGKGGLHLLKELKNLTQLHRLGLSGINRENWKHFCLAVSGHLPHLKSLSLRLLLVKEDDKYDFASFDDVSIPPKTLERLKVLYSSTIRYAGEGCASIRPVWLKQLGNLKEFQHVVTVSSQEDLQMVVEEMQWEEHPRDRLRVKPFEELLTFEGKDWSDIKIFVKNLVIDCSCNRLSDSRPMVRFNYDSPLHFEALNINCCCSGSSSASAGTSDVGSSSSCNLRVDGLGRLATLAEITVTGPCSDNLKEILSDDLRPSVVVTYLP